MINPPKATAEAYANYAGTHPRLNEWENGALQSISLQLIVRGRLSEKQIKMWWKLHDKVISDIKSKPDLELPDLYDKLETVAGKMQGVHPRPSIDLYGILIKRNSSQSKFPTSYAITNSSRDIYYGSLRHPSGEFWASESCTPTVLQNLLFCNDDLEEHIKEAVEGGQVVSCVFCRKALNHPSSIYYGYGPTCAENYNLPWGDTE